LKGIAGRAPKTAVCMTLSARVLRAPHRKVGDAGPIGGGRCPRAGEIGPPRDGL
jgi:hypothetical protein